MLSMFSVWQMGPVYYSSQAMSISGSNPFFIGPASSTLILAAGFVITIVFNLLFSFEKRAYGQSGDLHRFPGQLPDVLHA